MAGLGWKLGPLAPQNNALPRPSSNAAFSAPAHTVVLWPQCRCEREGSYTGLKPPMLEKGLCPLVSPCPPGPSRWNSKLGHGHLTPHVHQTHFVKEKPRPREETGESEFVQGSEEELGAKSRLLALAELSGEQGVRQGPELRPTSFGGPGHHSCCSQSSTQPVPA